MTEDREKKLEKVAEKAKAFVDHAENDDSFQMHGNVQPYFDLMDSLDELEA